MSKEVAAKEVMVKEPITADKKLEMMRDRDREMVKGVFKFYEVPGGLMSFVFKKYKKDPVEKFDLIDGHVYTIPLGVAKHLNNDCWYPMHENAVDENGKSIVRVSEKIRRCGFQSLEFMDIDDFSYGNKQVVMVEKLA